MDRPQPYVNQTGEENAELGDIVMSTDLTASLRALAAHEHDDHGVALEAVEEIKWLRLALASIELRCRDNEHRCSFCSASADEAMNTLEDRGCQAPAVFRPGGARRRALEDHDG